MIDFRVRFFYALVFFGSSDKLAQVGKAQYSVQLRLLVSEVLEIEISGLLFPSCIPFL